MCEMRYEDKELSIEILQEKGLDYVQLSDGFVRYEFAEMNSGPVVVLVHGARRQLRRQQGQPAVAGGASCRSQPAHRPGTGDLLAARHSREMGHSGEVGRLGSAVALLAQLREDGFRAIGGPRSRSARPQGRIRCRCSRSKGS